MIGTFYCQIFGHKFVGYHREYTPAYKKIAASTTKLNKSDFTDYLDKICALTNIPLPDPEAAGYISNV